MKVEHVAPAGQRVKNEVWRENRGKFRIIAVANKWAFNGTVPANAPTLCPYGATYQTLFFATDPLSLRDNIHLSIVIENCPDSHRESIERFGVSRNSKGILNTRKPYLFKVLYSPFRGLIGKLTSFNNRGVSYSPFRGRIKKLSSFRDRGVQ